MFQNIPQSRLIIYVLVLGLIPIGIAWFNFSNKKMYIQNVINQTEYLTDETHIREKKQAVNIAVREHYKNADHYYIDKYLETLKFLQPEIDTLQVLSNNKNFAGDENVKQRIEFLNEGANQLLFTEGSVQSFPNFQETVANLVHPVEVNVNDIKEILTLTEGVEMASHKAIPERPQILFLDFKIDRKEIYKNNEVYILNMKILKREFLQ